MLRLTKLYRFLIILFIPIFSVLSAYNTISILPHKAQQDIIQKVQRIPANSLSEKLLDININGLFYHRNLLPREVFPEGRGKFVMNKIGEIFFMADFDIINFRQRYGQIFFHSSFFSGGPVAMAGELDFKNGKLIEVNNASGHYLPEDKYIYQFISEIRKRGVTYPFLIKNYNGDTLNEEDLREQCKRNKRCVIQ